MKRSMAAMVLLVTLAACGEEPTPQAKDGASPDRADSVEILEISPTAGTTLKAGQEVTFELRVAFELVSHESGALTLVVQDAANEALVNRTYVVRKGKGVGTVSTEVTVPDTPTLRVFSPLIPQGKEGTSVVDSRVYQVEQ